MMRTVFAIVAVVALPVVSAAQDEGRKDDPSQTRVEVTGCARGSTLTETNLRVTDDDGLPKRKWRLRGPKALIKQLKEREGRELAIVGTTKNDDAMPGAPRRIGKTNIFIGANPNMPSRDPVPDLPTIEVEKFELTGEPCR